MYCFTYMNNYNCVYNELVLWSKISSEHPIFIQTVAKLSKKDLSQDTQKKLIMVHEDFSSLRKKIEKIGRSPYFTPHSLYNIMSLIEEFINYDRVFLNVLPEVKKYGKEDKVWQTLLDHITEEQTFMYELFSDLKNQVR